MFSMPCYARKALALHGLGEHVSSDIAASLAFYYDKSVFSDFAPFKETFLDLQKRIFVCDSVDNCKKLFIRRMWMRMCQRFWF